MAIALDKASTTYGPSTVASPFTKTLSAQVTTGGSDRLLLVTVTNLAVPQVDPATTISGVTYGGTAMTLVTSSMVAFNVWRSSIYYLLAPVAGTNSVVVTFSAKSNCAIGASSWTGVLQTGTFGTAVTASGTGTATSVTVTSAAGEIVIDATATNNGLTDTVGAGQTVLGSKSGIGSSSYEAGAGSVAMTWTISTSFPWTATAVPFKPSTTTSPIIVPPVVGDGGTQATAAATVAEMRISPLRAAPSGFSTQTGTPATIENNAAAWEASGLFNEIIMGTKSGPDFVWDTIYTPPSSAPAGVIRVCAMPAKNSPNGTLLFTAQDMMVAYPLPYTIDPVLTPYPIVAASTVNATSTSDLVPVFYPSAIDLGTGMYKVVAVEMIGENFTYEVDSWAFTYRWGETNPWETVQRFYQPNVIIPIPGENQGRSFHMAFSINDGVNTDPIGPQGAHIVVWVEQLEQRVDLPKQRDRQNATSGATEVS